MELLKPTETAYFAFLQDFSAIFWRWQKRTAVKSSSEAGK